MISKVELCVFWAFLFKFLFLLCLFWGWLVVFALPTLCFFLRRPFLLFDIVGLKQNPRLEKPQRPEEDERKVLCFVCLFASLLVCLFVCFFLSFFAFVFGFVGLGQRLVGWFRVFFQAIYIYLIYFYIKTNMYLGLPRFRPFFLGFFERFLLRPVDLLVFPQRPPAVGAWWTWPPRAVWACSWRVDRIEDRRLGMGEEQLAAHAQDIRICII